MVSAWGLGSDPPPSSMVILFNIFKFLDLFQMSTNVPVYHARTVVFAPMRLQDTHARVLLDLWELTVKLVSSLNLIPLGEWT